MYNEPDDTVCCESDILYKFNHLKIAPKIQEISACCRQLNYECVNEPDDTVILAVSESEILLSFATNFQFSNLKGWGGT